MGAYQHSHRREPPAKPVSTAPAAGAPRSAAPAAPPFTVTWKGKVSAAKGVALRPGAACQAEMTAAGPAVRRLRVACGGESLYDSSAAMSGTSSYGSAIIEAPGEHGGHRYLLVYHDVGQRTGRTEIQFNSMDSATITGHGASPFEVTARFDAISSERTGPALFPHSMVAAHQRFTAKVARVEGKAPVKAGQRCVLSFDGVGVKDDGDVCTVELTCGGQAVHDATSYCTVDCAGRPATYTDEQHDARFSLDVASRRVQMSGTPIGGAYSAELSLAPAGG